MISSTMEEKQEKPHFLSIPLEIRFHIYKLLVPLGPDQWDHETSLFHVCRQIHSEIIPMFIQNRFHPFDSLDRFVKWSQRSTKVGSPGMKLRKYVREVSIECGHRDLKSFRDWYESHKPKNGVRKLRPANWISELESEDSDSREGMNGDNGGACSGQWWEKRYFELVKEMSAPRRSLAAAVAAEAERYGQGEDIPDNVALNTRSEPSLNARPHSVSRVLKPLYKRIIPQNKNADNECSTKDASTLESAQLVSPIFTVWEALTAFPNIHTCWITQRSQPSTTSHRPTKPFLVEQRLILEMISSAWSQSLRNLRTMNGIVPLSYLSNCTELRSIEFSGYSTTAPEESTTNIFSCLPKLDKLLLQRFATNYDTQEYCVATKELPRYISITPSFLTNLSNPLRELKIMHLDQYVRSHFLTVEMIRALKHSHHTDSLRKLVLHDDSLPSIDDAVAREIKELATFMGSLREFGLRMAVSADLAVEFGLKRSGRQQGEARAVFVSPDVAGEVYIYFFKQSRGHMQFHDLLGI